jgi:hypothetical protein
VLPEAERQRRAEAARRAHMQRLAFRSAKARSARRPGTPRDRPHGAAYTRSRPARAGRARREGRAAGWRLRRVHYRTARRRDS